MTVEVSELERLHRLDSALGRIHRAIVRKRSRDDLCQAVCAALVDQGGVAMARIAWRDPANPVVTTVAQAGDAGGRSAGDGCASFTIPASGTVAGTLSVYSDRPGGFHDAEVALLAEAAGDLSFALDKLGGREGRGGSADMLKWLIAITESTDDAMVSMTVDGTVTSWNRAAERMFGYGAGEMLGRSLEVLVPPECRDEPRQILQQLGDDGRLQQLETVRRRKDGTHLPVSISVAPFRAPDEARPGATKILGVAAILRDITERKQAEAIAQREQRFASGLIEAMPGVFYFYDEEGRFLRWNRNFERVTGYSAEEIASMRPLDFFADEEKALVRRRIAAVFDEGEAAVEARMLGKDGSATPYYLTGKRIVFDGAPRLIGVGVDITEHKRAEEAVQRSEERYRTTLDGMLEGCQLLGHDWRYLYLNPAAASQNRRPNAELLGRRMPDAWPGIEGTEVFALLRRCMDERIAVRDDIRFGFADGSTAWFAVSAQPVPEGIFVLSIDITKRYQAEHALRELNESLERKVVERTIDLQAACERAEAADRIKSAFLASMSHELRTPLNSILGFTGIVLKGMAGPLNTEQTKQLGMVQTSARHLLELINDVLDISKIEAGQLEVRCAPFDLRAAVERVAASVLPLAEKKGLALRVAVPASPAPMASDRRRVEQILLNLLNNAVKFTDRGAVTLTADIVDERARIRVADSGIGMKAEDLSKLFQPFRQLDSGLQRQHEGTGLGLSICRRLTELLGGAIDAASVWGEGSVFTVVLPLKPAGIP
jgi:PAS domain S-box-containing protein